MTIEPLAVVEKAYALFRSGDTDAIVAMVSDEAEWTSVGPPDLFEVFGARKGRTGAADYFAKLRHHITPAQNVAPAPFQFIARGDTVVVQGHTTGIFSETGKPIDSDWVHILTVKDGQITGYKEFVDSAQAVL
jgi:ketosteroid isomerase-like protein